MEKKSRTNLTLWLGIMLGVILAVVLTIHGIQQVRAAAVFIISIDDAGADDEPGQKDLNFVETGIDTTTPNLLYVNWGLDNTDWSGANTGDVCALFDTDSDGFANYSYCVTVNGSPASILYNRLWLCSDKKDDRCTSGNSILFNYTTGVTVNIEELDPFGLPTSPDYNPLHVTGNICSALTTPSCYTFDTHVETVIPLTDMGAPTVSPQLINVCSFPSESPGSDPSDCIYQAGAGFLKIVKVAQPNLPVGFTFNMGTSQVSTAGKSSWTITGSGSTTSVIAFAPGTTYDLTEVVPAGWSLSSASCVRNSLPTGTLVGTTITDFTITTGATTTCTFTNTRPVDLTIDKTDYDYLYGYATRGGLINYMITVTNADTVANPDNSASAVVVTDVLDINISVDTDPWFTPGIQFSPIISRNGVLDPSVVCAVTGSDPMGYGGTITCPLGTMAALEVVTIEFPATVDYDTPIESPIEFGLCTQNPDLQGIEAVDICNTVSVYSPDELAAQTGNNTDSDPKDVGKPTAVDVYNFTAIGLRRVVKLEWETQNEVDHLGFNLYRAASLDGARTKVTQVNDELIAGHTYFDYVKGEEGTYYYWLQSVDINGQTESFGPVEVKVLKR